MGLNTWAAFFGSDANAEIAGRRGPCCDDDACPEGSAKQWLERGATTSLIGGATWFTSSITGAQVGRETRNGFKSALNELGKARAAHTGH